MDISLVIPLKDEEESLPELSEWINRVMNANNYSYEIIFVDDGSTDNSWKIIEELRDKNPNIKGIKFQRNYGKSAGLNEGFRAAQGDVIITMDADLQDPPEAVPLLLDRARELGGTVFARRSGRYERWDRLVTSRAFKAVLRWVSGVPENVGTFFVVDAGVADAMCRMGVPSTQVVILAHHCSPAWDVVPVTRAQRALGRSAYSSAARVRAALRSLRCAIECRRSSGREGINPSRSVALAAQRVNL